MISKLRKAQALIADPSKWGKGAYHNKITGQMCALGACYGAGLISATETMCDILEEEFDDPSVLQFNDSPKTTHADVMALFDLAIAVEEVGGGI
jgi:hypothetical protein